MPTVSANPCLAFNVCRAKPSSSDARSAGVAFAEAEDPERARRRRRGKRMGIVGLVVLFTPALFLRVVPSSWVPYLLGLMAASVAVLLYSYLLVR